MLNIARQAGHAPTHTSLTAHNGGAGLGFVPDNAPDTRNFASTVRAIWYKGVNPSPNRRSPYTLVLAQF